MLSKPSTFLTYMDLSNFFNLNPCFLVNFKLITNYIALLSNNVSTVIPSCISILSKPIFTVTFLKRSPLSRLHNIFFVILLNIVNLLLLLRFSWDSLDLYPHLNYYYCPLFPFSCSSLLPYFYNTLLNIQNPHIYNNFYYFYPHLWYIGSFEKTLPSVEELPSLCSFSPLFLLE